MSVLENSFQASQESRQLSTKEYYPLSDTLRLYAGWLLAWYFLIYSFGGYQETRKLPFHIQIIQSLFESPLVLIFSVVCFLFLLLSSIHRLLGRSVLMGVLLTVLGIGLFIVFEVHV
jgi:hypothetical protein